MGSPPHTDRTLTTIKQDLEVLSACALQGQSQGFSGDIPRNNHGGWDIGVAPSKMRSQSAVYSALAHAQGLEMLSIGPSSQGDRVRTTAEALIVLTSCSSRHCQSLTAGVRRDNSSNPGDITSKLGN